MALKIEIKSYETGCEKIGYNKKEEGDKDMKKLAVVALGMVATGIMLYNIGKVNGTEETLDSLRPAIVALNAKTAELTVNYNELETKLAEVKDESLTDLREGGEYGAKFKTSTFKITAYSPYDNVNGIQASNTKGITATGAIAQPGTFAVDPSVIPYGSTVIIMYPDGTIERGRAEDTGGMIKGTHIDVFRHTFKTAVSFGVQNAVVIWYKKES